MARNEKNQSADDLSGCPKGARRGDSDVVHEPGDAEQPAQHDRSRRVCDRLVPEATAAQEERSIGADAPQTDGADNEGQELEPPDPGGANGRQEYEGDRSRTSRERKAIPATRRITPRTSHSAE